MSNRAGRLCSYVGKSIPHSQWLFTIVMIFKLLNVFSECRLTPGGHCLDTLVYRDDESYSLGMGISWCILIVLWGEGEIYLQYMYVVRLVVS